MKILIVEDEPGLQTAMCSFLEKEDYICESANSFQKANEKISLYEYDIILLDITLPDGNGLNLIEKVKSFNPESGLIIISAKNSLDDKINGLDLGADYYMTKPFQLSELNSRIKAVLRRRQFGGSKLIHFNEISVDTDSKSVHVHGQEIRLTKKEYDILLFFIINKNRVLTKAAIAEHLWEDNIDLADNYDFIYIHVNNIRKKIESAGGTDYLKTIYGMGYKFTDR